MSGNMNQGFKDFDYVRQPITGSKTVLDEYDACMARY